jgi:RNA polymerase sigma-70 factor, ECF subfamily
MMAPSLTSEIERQICEKYANRIRAYGLRHLHDMAAAQDLVQHVLLAVLQARRAGRIADPQRLDAYVLGTCRNSVMDFRRAAIRARKLAEHTEGLPEDHLPAWRGVDRGRLERCVGRLEPRARAVVIATFVEDRDADDIGRELAVSAGNVRVIRHRALARLLACLEGGTE